MNTLINKDVDDGVNIYCALMVYLNYDNEKFHPCNVS